LAKKISLDCQLADLLVKLGNLHLIYRTRAAHTALATSEQACRSLEQGLLPRVNLAGMNAEAARQFRHGAVLLYTIVAVSLDHRTLASGAQAEHLTNVIRRSGGLGEGRVLDVVVESSDPTLLSRIIRLRLTYEAAVDAPSSLILRLGSPLASATSRDQGRQEVEFYNKVAAVISTRLVPRCFEAVWDPDTKAWHLLLEDLTNSHIIAITWPQPPTMEQCERILHALARLHAEWWDDPPSWRLPREIA
jgi:hypothetical protein